MLVPFAASAHATNATPPTLTFSTATVLGSGTYSETITITNPAGNQYAITGLVVTVPSTPSGWTVTGASVAASNFFSNVITTPTSASYTTNAPLPPGSSDTVTLTGAVPGGVYPWTSTFTTTIQDASSAAYSVGPSISLQVIAPSSAIVLTVTPSGSNGVTSYTAGTGAYTISAQLTCTVSVSTCPTGYQNGVTIGWAESGYATGTAYSLTSTSAVTSGTGVTGGSASATFQPSNIATSAPATVEAWVGGTVASPLVHTSTAAITTHANAPTTISFSLITASVSAPFPATDYLTTSGTSTNLNVVAFTGAELAYVSHTSGVNISAADQFGNPDSFGTGGVTFLVAGQGIAVQTATGAVFDKTGLPSVTTLTNPTSGTSVAIPYNYFQSATYGTTGILTATISGTYNGITFSITGSSGNIQTSAFGEGSGTFVTTATGHATMTAQTVVAGGSTTVDFKLSTAQSNVPVTIALCTTIACGSTTGYSGTFTSSGLNWVALTTNSTGIASATFKVATKADDVAIFNATVSQPTNTLATHKVITGPSASVTTTAGVATKFGIIISTTSPFTPTTITTSVPGTTLYVDVTLTDAYGNIAPNAGTQQVQVLLAASGGAVSVTSAYIAPMADNTIASFGAISWTIPSTVGTVLTLTASGVLNGTSTSTSSTLTIVSDSPTISVTSPTAVSGLIYSNSFVVTFRGQANASTGYNGVVHIARLGYKVGSGSWLSSTLTGVTNTWSLPLVLPIGLSAISFNTTDTNGNVATSSTYTVLVATAAPTLTFVTASGASLVTQPIQATIVDSAGILNASSVGITYNGTALPATAITILGTNAPGNSVTYTVSATIPQGHWTVTLSAKDLAGNVATPISESVTVVTSTTGDFTVTGTPAQANFNQNPDSVAISYVNNLPTAQSVTVKGTAFIGSTQYAVGTSNLINLGTGQGSTAYISFIGLTPGQAYTVHIWVISSTGVVISTTTLVTVTA